MTLTAKGHENWRMAWRNLLFERHATLLLNNSVVLLLMMHVGLSSAAHRLSENHLIKIPIYLSTLSA